MTILNKLYEILNGITYTRSVPEEAIKIAKENNYIIVVGGSDDLMLAYGTKSYLTDYEEHGYGSDGETFEDIGDKKLQKEANQLDLEIFWCGENQKNKLENYNWEKQGAFSYRVNKNIESKEFTVFEDKDKKEVYCTGLIIKMPNNFKKEEI